MRDLQLCLMAGVEIPVPALELTIHQPTLKEISFIGETNFFIAVQYLCLDKRLYIKDETLLQSMTNFQVLMAVISDDKTSDKKNAILSLFTVLFPSFKAIFTPRGILLNNMTEQKIVSIDDNNFDELQNLMIEIFCARSAMSGENIVYNPGNAKARAIADKIMRGRQKVAEMKGENTESLLARYISIAAIGFPNMSMSDILQFTIYQLYDLIERFTLYRNWDIDMRVRLAGGKPETQVDNWMKSIH